MTDRYMNEILSKNREVAADIERLNAHAQRGWEIAALYTKLCEEIPGGLPNGTGIMGPNVWIRWAKKELGYNAD